MARTGSLVNHLSDRSTSDITPEVGMGATLIHWSDRTPLTITDVSKTAHRIFLQEDSATRTDSNGMSDAQSYDYTPNPDGRTHEATRRRDGSYRIKGGDARVLIGSRSKYHDYSF
jgi:hypothetical protein